MQRYFITGTDTDCGKTYVTCMLLDSFVIQSAAKDPLAIPRCHSREILRCAQDDSFLAIKPIASGLVLENEQWLSPDVIALNKHNPQHHFNINPWCFKTPVSPHIAARLEGQEISLQALSDYCFHPQFDIYDVLLIEGAGGVMAPITDTLTWVDFLKETRIPSIVVVGMKLGCLNHALMTISVLKSNDLPIHGFIANQIDPNMLAFDENLATLQARLGVPYLGIMPYGGLSGRGEC